MLFLILMETVRLAAPCAVREIKAPGNSHTQQRGFRGDRSSSVRLIEWMAFLTVRRCVEEHAQH
jgi:hypothetical protein